MATRPSERPAAAPRLPADANGQPTAASAGPRVAVPQLSPELSAELALGGWDTSWALTPALHTPARWPGARQATWTRERMIEGPARDALAMSDDPTALALACGEGWLCHELLAWGARRVVGVEARPRHLRRARLLREHFAVSAEQLDLRAESEKSAGGRYDVVVLAGVTGSAAEDLDLPRLAASATGGICAIECRGADAEAVAGVALAAGLASVEIARPPLHAHPLHLREELVVLIGRPGESA